MPCERNISQYALEVQRNTQNTPHNTQHTNSIKKLRRQQGSNLRGRSPTDFKSVSLTTRTYRLVVLGIYFIFIYNKLLHLTLFFHIYDNSNILS